CLAPELDLKYEKLYAYLQNDVTRKRAIVDLILNLLCSSSEEKIEARGRFQTAAPLFQHRLLLFSGGIPPEQTPFLSRFVKIDDRILNYLLDVEAMDEQLLPFTRLIIPRATLEESLLPDEFKESLARLFLSRCLSARDNDGHRGFLFYGPKGVGK